MFKKHNPLTQVSFDVSEEDSCLIQGIATRFLKENSDLGIKQQDLEMDLTAVHCNGCRLDLEKLLSANDLTLTHDVLGINRYIDRSTGALRSYFLPRCMAKSAVQR